MCLVCKQQFIYFVELCAFHERDNVKLLCGFIDLIYAFSVIDTFQPDV